jgi:hypothetical protein
MKTQASSRRKTPPGSSATPVCPGHTVTHNSTPRVPRQEGSVNASGFPAAGLPPFWGRKRVAQHRGRVSLATWRDPKTFPSGAVNHLARYWDI